MPIVLTERRHSPGASSFLGGTACNDRRGLGVRRFAAVLVTLTGLAGRHARERRGRPGRRPDRARPGLGDHLRLASPTTTCTSATARRCGSPGDTSITASRRLPRRRRQPAHVLRASGERHRLLGRPRALDPIERPGEHRHAASISRPSPAGSGSPAASYLGGTSVTVSGGIDTSGSMTGGSGAVVDRVIRAGRARRAVLPGGRQRAGRARLDPRQQRHAHRGPHDRRQRREHHQRRRRSTWPQRPAPVRIGGNVNANGRDATGGTGANVTLRGSDVRVGRIDASAGSGWSRRRRARRRRRHRREHLGHGHRLHRRARRRRARRATVRRAAATSRIASPRPDPRRHHLRGQRRRQLLATDGRRVDLDQRRRRRGRRAVHERRQPDGAASGTGPPGAASRSHRPARSRSTRSRPSAATAAVTACRAAPAARSR